MELTPGTIIERYVVEAEIGRGGMAVVYRVRHARLGSQHALKLLSLTSRSLQQRLIQEGQVQATLRHPNVVSVTDVIDVQGQSGLLMEFVEGPTLEDWMTTRKPTFAEAEQLFRGILSAVAAAHERDLIHRDLKPANVLLAPHSGTYLPKVTDFGLAKALAETNSGPGTRSGVSMGTPKYMAPEQIRDAGGVDKRADLFSLGCILYELVSGAPPFDGPDVLTVFNRVATGSFAPLPAEVPEHLARAVHACLIVDPRARVADCATLQAVLDGVAYDAHAPSQAHPVGGTLLPESFAGGSSETWSPELAHGTPVGQTAAPAQTGGHLGGVQVASQARTVDSRTSGHAEASETLVPGGSDAGASTLDPSLPPAPRRTRRRWLLAGAFVGIGAAVVLLVLLIGAGAGWYMLTGWHRARIEQVLAAHTESEVQVGSVALSPAQVVVRDVQIVGRDGQPVLQAPRVTLHGKTRWFLLGLDRLDDVKVHGLTLDLRQDDTGWVLPERTLAWVQGDATGGAFGEIDLEIFDARLTARTDRGVLTARVDLLDFNELKLDQAGWRTEGLEVRGVHVDGAQPIGSMVDLVVRNNEARVRGLDLWVRSRRDGRLDLPPVLAEGVPHYLGGELESGGDSWFVQAFALMPFAVDAIRFESGQVHLVDTAHAVRDVTWTLNLDQAGATREGVRWHLTAQGRVADGRAILDGGMDADGRFEGRLDLRDLPLVAFGPYLDTDLAERGVRLAEGRSEAVFVLEETGAALGWQGVIALDDVVLEPIEGGGPRGRDRRLLEPRAHVEVEAEGLGVLSDPSYQPVEDVRVATLEALLEPAGQLPVLRRIFDRTARGRSSSDVSAEAPPPTDLLDPDAPDVDNQPGDVIARDTESADVDPSLPDAPDDVSVEPVDTVPESMVERWRRRRAANRDKVREWLEERF